jgi:hypothetical protein
VKPVESARIRELFVSIHGWILPEINLHAIHFKNSPQKIALPFFTSYIGIIMFEVFF